MERCLNPHAEEAFMKIKEAQQLLAQKKYKQAAELLDFLLSSDKDNAELWYLRGVASMKLKKYDAAQDHFERALFSDKKSKYYQTRGMAYLEIFQIHEAIDAFENAIDLDQTDVVSVFFLAICFMFLDDPRSSDYMQMATALNARKTKQLLLNFYNMFLKNDPAISNVQKSKILERIDTLEANSVST